MPRPPTRRPSRSTPKPLTGNNDRRIGVALPLLAPGIRAWMASFGSLTAFAKRVRCDASIPRKIVTGQITIPERAALDWPKRLGLTGTEANDIAAVVALSSAHVGVLRFFSADWKAQVEQLGERLKRYAAKRRSASK